MKTSDITFVRIPKGGSFFENASYSNMESFMPPKMIMGPPVMPAAPVLPFMRAPSPPAFSMNESVFSKMSNASSVPEFIMPEPPVIKQDNFLRRLFRRGNTRNISAVAPQRPTTLIQPIQQTTTYKEKYIAFIEKLKKSSSMIYYIVGIIVSKLMEIGRKKEPGEKDYTLQMAGGLFITGFVVHVLCEAFGFNKWYCNHGYACNSTH